MIYGSFSSGKRSLSCKSSVMLVVSFRPQTTDFGLLGVFRTKRYMVLVVPKELRRNPIEDGAISGFKGQKSVPE